MTREELAGINSAIIGWSNFFKGINDREEKDRLLSIEEARYREKKEEDDRRWNYAIERDKLTDTRYNEEKKYNKAKDIRTLFDRQYMSIPIKQYDEMEAYFPKTQDLTPLELSEIKKTLGTPEETELLPLATNGMRLVDINNYNYLQKKIDDQEATRRTILANNLIAERQFRLQQNAEALRIKREQDAQDAYEAEAKKVQDKINMFITPNPIAVNLATDDKWLEKWTPQVEPSDNVDKFLLNTGANSINNLGESFGYDETQRANQYAIENIAKANREYNSIWHKTKSENLGKVVNLIEGAYAAKEAFLETTGLKSGKKTLFTPNKEAENQGIENLFRYYSALEKIIKNDAFEDPKSSTARGIIYNPPAVTGTTQIFSNPELHNPWLNVKDIAYNTWKEIGGIINGSKRMEELLKLTKQKQDIQKQGLQIQKLQQGISAK